MNFYSALAILMRLCPLRYALFILLCAVSCVQAAEAPRVLVVLSDSNPLYQAFANTISQNLPTKVTLDVLQRPEDWGDEASAADLVVTVGARASTAIAAKTRAPLLAAMIPSHKYKEISAGRPRNSQTSAVFVNQSWSRQLALVRAAMPGRNRVGLLYSSQSELDLAELRNKAKQLGLRLSEEKLDSSIFEYEDLNSILNRSDVLLAIPDSAIYNSNNIRNILIESYNRKVPLVGYSQPYVNAGALCAAYSTPEQLAAQTSAMVSDFIASSRLPDAQYPVLYHVAINQNVARTLGFTIPSGDLLHLQIDQIQGEYQ